MKRFKKCKECMKIAEEQHGMRGISKQYLYQLIRPQCKHIKEGED